MARPLRIEYPGAFHHVTARGVARQPIFLDDADRQAFLKRLAELEYRWRLRIHAYCLMTNHYHLEVETIEPNLSRGLQWLNHVYASYVNWRHGRAGHLFQGRFKSALVEAETHLHALTGYIHMNPVRGGLVKEPSDYTWSSYRAYLALVRPPVWLATRETLRRFGSSRSEQARHYRQFVEGETAGDPLKEMFFGAVVGSARFVNWVRSKLAARRIDAEVSHLAKAKAKPSLASVCGAVSQDYELREADLRIRRRKRNEPRDVAIFLSRECAGVRNIEIGTYYGGIGAAAVSLACARIENRVAENPRFRRRMFELAGRIAAAVPAIKY